MLFKQEIRKYIAILLILFLIFQCMPSAFANAKRLDHFTRKSPIFISKSVTHTGTTLLSRSSRKSSFYPAGVEFYDTSISSAYFAGIDEDKSFYSVSYPDYRKKIKQVILNYFHGGKYKDNYLSIYIHRENDFTLKN